MTATPTPFADLGERGMTDSQFWFPELHRRGTIGLAVHYALGLIGEIGEAEEATFVTRSFAGLGHEVADCLIYAADLAHVMKIDLDGTIIDAKAEGIVPVTILIGHLANGIKKLNRVNAFTPDVQAEALDACRATIRIPLGQLTLRTLTIARNFDFDPFEAIEAKRAILCERWGTPS
jgi:NTP pyrophosphatase (non-canonical NTP hydrolase)